MTTAEAKNMSFSKRFNQTHLKTFSFCLTFGPDPGPHPDPGPNPGPYSDPPKSAHTEIPERST
jgi:hypothetical protein